MAWVQRCRRTGFASVSATHRGGVMRSYRGAQPLDLTVALRRSHGVSLSLRLDQDWTEF